MLRETQIRLYRNWNYLDCSVLYTVFGGFFYIIDQTVSGCLFSLCSVWSWVLEAWSGGLEDCGPEGRAGLWRTPLGQSKLTGAAICDPFLSSFLLRGFNYPRGCCQISILWCKAGCSSNGNFCCVWVCVCACLSLSKHKHDWMWLYFVYIWQRSNLQLLKSMASG